MLQSACAGVMKALFGASTCDAICEVFSDGRQEVAKKAMAQLTLKSEVSATSIFDVLSTAPVLNSDTAFTTFMSPATDEFRTTVRGGHTAPAWSKSRLQA